MLILILIILSVVNTQLPQLNIFIAVQNKNQIFMSALPYIDTCNYNQSKIIQGAINMQPLSSNKIFDAVALENVISFWTPVQNGFDIALVLPDSVSNYSGYVLYNSNVQYTNRQLIVYNIIQSSLIFYYVQPNLNSQTLQLSLTVLNQTLINLSPSAEKILSSCKNKLDSSIVYIGNGTFLYLCSSVRGGFTFVPMDSSVDNVIVDTSGLQDGYYNTTSNPELLNSYTLILSLPYNGLLLITTQNSSILYLIEYNQTEINFIPFGRLKQQLIILINRIWGQQFRLQTPKWMDVYKTIIDIDGLYFPGDIVSVYVDYQQDIYIQSVATTGQTYLSALSNLGNVYWNISFQGQVFLYGSQIVFIYNDLNSQVSTLQIQRPIFIINISDFGNDTAPNTISTLNLTIQCQSVDILVNYQILWTTPEYPTAYVQQLFGQSAVTNVSVYSILLSESYLVIGPDLKVLPNYPVGLSVFVIDQTTEVINNSATGVIGVWVDTDVMFQVIIVTNTTVYQVTLQNGVIALPISPCGLDVIVSAQKISDNQISLYGQSNQTCICYTNFSSCQIVTPNTTAPTANPTTLPTNQPSTIFNSANNQSEILFKKNLFGLIKTGYVISILQNNSAVLVNATNKVALDMVQLTCQINNSTNGLIYIGQFQSPVLILYCQGSSQLNQYLITNNKLQLNRVIPLYGFTARAGQYNLQIAQSFVFLQVDPINIIYPEIQNCCVLKLNFSDFTISVIDEVIYAQLVLVYGFEGSYNFVVLGSNRPGVGPQTIVTIYFINQWVTFNQTDHFQVLQENIPITMGFYSFVYNFGFRTQFLLTYNLTNLNLNINPPIAKNKSLISPIIYMNSSSSTSTYDTVYSAQFNYNLSEYVCGAVFHNFFLKGDSQDQDNLQIYQRDIIIPYKLIGQIGAIKFIQIINPQNWDQDNLTLNNLLLLVASNQIYVYAKVLNNVQMVNIGNITLSELSCQYYLYDIINNTAVIMTSQCLGLNVSQQTPFITINYNPHSTNPITYSISQIIFPIQLRDVFTILTTQVTMYVGILEGPFSSQTGKLVLCQSVNCSYLYISTAYSFLLQYSALQVDNQTYYIMALDVFTIGIYICPQMQIPGVLIPPNYTLTYSSAINQTYCSSIKIINSTSSESYIILSCTQYYYVLLLQFHSKKITIIQKFTRYCNCELYDNFKPQIIQNSQGLMMFIAQCRISQIILKIKAYEGFLNKSLTVHTGYLQVFTFSGPMGPNCTNDTISPVKILTLQCQMDRPLIKVYKLGQVNKFIYSQINGILIDNYIQQFPLVQLTFRPQSSVYTFPTIQLMVTNQFHTVYQTVITAEQIIFQIKVMDYLIFFFFILANVINLLCIICFFIQKKSLKQRMRLESLVYRQNNYDDINSQSNQQRASKLQFFSRSLSQTIKGSSHSKNKSLAKSKSVEMELFFYKRPKRFQ